MQRIDKGQERERLPLMTFTIRKGDGSMLGFTLNGMGVIGDGVEFPKGARYGVPVDVDRTAILGWLAASENVWMHSLQDWKKEAAVDAFLIKVLLGEAS